jgi:hypothetical protein
VVVQLLRRYAGPSGTARPSAWAAPDCALTSPSGTAARLPLAIIVTADPAVAVVITAGPAAVVITVRFAVAVVITVRFAVAVIVWRTLNITVGLSVAIPVGLALINRLRVTAHRMIVILPDGHRGVLVIGGRCRAPSIVSNIGHIQRCQPGGQSRGKSLTQAANGA